MSYLESYSLSVICDNKFIETIHQKAIDLFGVLVSKVVFAGQVRAAFSIDFNKFDEKQRHLFNG